VSMTSFSQCVEQCNSQFLVSRYLSHPVGIAASREHLCLHISPDSWSTQRLPFCLRSAKTSLKRSTIMFRSNSAKTPSIPAGVVVSNALLVKEKIRLFTVEFTEKAD
jgi:hypothetical protein